MSETLLYDERVTEVQAAKVAGGELWLTAGDLERATGWKSEPQGMCRGDVCVQTDPEWLDGDKNVNITAFAGHLGQPLVRESASHAWAFGESAGVRNDQRHGTTAPDFALPDLDGNIHKLSDFRGKKVFLYTWGSY